MSLDIELKIGNDVMYEANITHNLTKMASHVKPNLYEIIWNCDVTNAGELIKPLTLGIEFINNNKSLKKFNPPNLWGSYDILLKFCYELLDGCVINPDATVEISK